MRFLKFNKKAAAIGMAVGLTLGMGGVAFAYFTSNGTGTGHAVVGTDTSWTVTFVGVTGSATSSTTYLYPGSYQTLTFNLHNGGGGIQHFTIKRTDYSVANTGTGNVVTATTTTPVTGCLVAWFSFPSTTPRHPTPTTNGATSGTVTPGGTTHVTVTIHMSNGTGTGSNQNACKTVHPKVTLNFTNHPTTP